MAVAIPSGNALAQAACDDISRDVTAAILKDTDKTLMIVEDALVINEACAADIIRAAILASHADAALANQIVQTGISVAPKMAGVITDAANSVAPGAIVASSTEVTAVAVPTSSGKNMGKVVLPVITSEIEEEFAPVSSSIRGIYLIQPPPSGFPPRKDCDCPISPSTSTP
ncbi:MAG: hypothetical protein U0984_14780 [Prosthecobacter sp.]|nr:hypothetical protein [Prosthecobacter sp.]